MRLGALIGNVVLGAATVAALAVGGFVLVTQMRGERMQVVQGHSMEPTIPFGSMTVLERVPVKSLRAGDVISFPQPGTPEVRVTHRIEQVTRDGGASAFVTKGDNNLARDPWKVQFVGDTAWRVRMHVAVVGRIYDLAQRPTARLVLVVVPVALLAGAMLIGIWRREPVAS